MRPLPLQNQLQPREVEQLPGLLLLAPVDSALEALVLALRSRHHRLSDYPHPVEPWDLELRRAQLVASLARALQAAIADYHSDQLRQLDKLRSNDGDSEIPW